MSKKKGKTVLGKRSRREVAVVSAGVGQGMNVHVVDWRDIPGGNRKFQVFDIATGAVIAEARTRRGAMDKMVNFLMKTRFRIKQYGQWVSPEPSERTMKVKVKRVDGRIEVLTLYEPLSFRNGPDDSILRSGFVDHFFCEDGRYNGFGANTSGRVHRQLNQQRVIED